jgi:phosphoserine aminotransferase
LYVDSGPFAGIAAKEAKPYGDIRIIASSKETQFDRVPAVPPDSIEQDAAYLHITTNNTIVGTRWNEFPNSGRVPLIGDCTSEILSRKVDYSRFGALYAGFQKKIGTAGTALVAIRSDLLGSAMAETPAALAGMVELKGHRSVGGIRASVYNAMPLEGVQALAAFMQEFEKKNG